MVFLEVITGRWERAMLAEWKLRQTSALTDVQPHSHTCNTTLSWTAWIKNFWPWGQCVKFKYCLRYHVPKKYWQDWPQEGCVCVQSLYFIWVLFELWEERFQKGCDQKYRQDCQTAHASYVHLYPTLFSLFHMRNRAGADHACECSWCIANSVKVRKCKWHQLGSHKSMVWVHFWCRLQGLKLCSCACMCDFQEQCYKTCCFNLWDNQGLHCWLRYKMVHFTGLIRSMARNVNGHKCDRESHASSRKPCISLICIELFILPFQLQLLSFQNGTIPYKWINHLFWTHLKFLLLSGLWIVGPLASIAFWVIFLFGRVWWSCKDRVFGVLQQVKPLTSPWGLVLLMPEMCQWYEAVQSASEMPHDHKILCSFKSQMPQMLCDHPHAVVQHTLPQRTDLEMIVLIQKQNPKTSPSDRGTTNTYVEHSTWIYFKWTAAWTSTFYVVHAGVCKVHANCVSGNQKSGRSQIGQLKNWEYGSCKQSNLPCENR